MKKTTPSNARCVLCERTEIVETLVPTLTKHFELWEGVSALENNSDWQVIDGATLDSEFLNVGTLRNVLPTSSGIYMWKISCSSGLNPMDAEAILGAVRHLVSDRMGGFSDIQIGHSLHISDVSFRGQGLTADKLRILKILAASGSNRKYLLNFLRSMEPHLPSLYVGESADLARRAEEHITFKTGFSERLRDEIKLKFTNLNFFFLGIPNSSQAVRQTLEYITAISTGGYLVRRPG